jgi:hypothetical protein
MHLMTAEGCFQLELLPTEEHAAHNQEPGDGRLR